MAMKRRVLSQQKSPKTKTPTSSSKEAAQIVPAWKPHAPLPWFEMGLYWIGWIGSILYVFYSTYTKTQDVKDQIHENDLTEGWTIIGRKKDNSNYEWNFWTVVFMYKLIGALALHSVGGLIVSQINHKWKKLYSPLICLLCLFMELGPLPTLVVSCQCIMSYAVIMLNKPVILWIVQLLFHYTLITEPYRTWQFGRFSPSSLHTDLMQFTSMMSVLRYISFGMEYHWYTNSHRADGVEKTANKERRHWDSAEDTDETQDKGKQRTLTFSLLDLFLYNFYVPLYFNGPLITYQNFLKKFEKPYTLSRPQIISLLWDSVSVIWWYFVLEIHNHFFYSLSMVHYQEIFMESNAWVLTGFMYTHLMFFLTKYVVFYRGCGIFAKLDNLDPPKAPKCVSCLYLFSDMWKYFDRGLYTYLKRYIYIPLGGSKLGLFRQLLASFLTFAFIWYWHGGYAVYFVWFLGNWLGVCTEAVAGMVLKWPSVQKIEGKLSPSMSRRVRAVFGVTTIVPLIVSNLVFLCGTSPVWAYVKIMFYSGWPVNTVTLLFFMYQVVQCVMESHRLRGTKE